MWIIETSLWISNSSSRMVRNSKMLPDGKIRMGATLLDKSVCLRAEKGPIMASVKACGLNVLEITKARFWCWLELRFGRKGKCDREVDFACGRFVNFWIWFYRGPRRDREWIPRQCVEGNESIYLRMKLQTQQANLLTKKTFLMALARFRVWLRVRVITRGFGIYLFYRVERNK